MLPLIGQVFSNEENIYWAVVRSIIHAEAAIGTPASLEMGHNDWKEMLDIFDTKAEGMVVGWYHTHPNELQVFMSGVDMATQQSMFCEEWHFAVVLNPHRERWGVYIGAEATPCKGYFLDRPVLD